MIKKTWLLIAGLLLSSPVIVSAQSAVGDWYQYPVFSNSVSKIIETNNKVFYLSNGNLFSFCPEDNSSYSYTSNNKLSDNTISDIYYDYDKKNLVVAYETGNIDVIKEDGTVKNLPDIKDALLTTRKDINDIAFGKNLMAVATQFGVVVYDANKLEVKESGNFNKPIEKVAIIGNDLVLYYDFSFNASPLSQRHNTLDKFTKLKSLNNFSIGVLDNNEVIVVSKNKASTGNYAIYIYRHDDVNHTWTQVYETFNVKTGDNPILRKFNGGYLLQNGKDVTLFRSSSDITTVTLPDTMAKDYVAFYSNQNKLWAGGESGVGYFDISGSTPVVLYNYMVPNGSTCKEVAFMASSPDGSRLYLSNLGPSLYRTLGSGDGYWIMQTTSMLKDGQFTDVSCENASTHMGIVTDNQRNTGKTRIMGPSAMVVNPYDPDMYFMSTVMEGVYAVKNNEEVNHFFGAPFYAAWGDMAYDINIDPQNNLWVGIFTNNYNGIPYYILPAEKLRGDVSQVQMSDWIPVPGFKGKYKGEKDMFSVFCKHSNMAFFGCGKWAGDVVMVDTKGTYADPSDDDVILFPDFKDQDGKTYYADRYVCGVEDQKGRIWIGTSGGIFEITDPKQYTSPSVPIKRLKVPRNDGTIYADYLLESDQVNAIAVDHANRKWVATEASGVYLVSEDGDKILEHYTTENSSLPSNSVFSIHCDVNGNKVYFGTAYGLVSFNSKAGPAQSDFSNVLAYPNPVRPEYTGWITISGLMDSSLVKITDAAGQVLFTTTSEGGMAMWDGCNMSGDRVKSGVYYVIASQSGDGHTEAIVSKILVIN